MIKAVIFDFGGTLDTDGVHWSAKFWKAYQVYVKSLSLQDFRKAYVYSENLMTHSIKSNDSFLATLNKQVELQFQYLIGTNLSPEDNSGKLINEISYSCYSDVLNKIENAKIILTKLKADYQLSLVSNFYGNIETVLKELSIHHFFSSIIDSTVVNLRKPDPAIFELAVNSLGLKSKECVVVGDSYERDIEPSKKINCHTIWLKGESWCEPSNTSSADFAVKSLSEVPAVIKKIVLSN